MRTYVNLMIASFVASGSVSVVEAEGYPEASLEQATFETIQSLKIERFAGLDEEALQAEYQWALDMARLCLGDPESIRDREAWWTYATEFQRHAGRTARYRGFGEQAIEDYETATDYAYESARLLGDAHPEFDPEDWEKQTIWRDIADTYFMMSAYELAAAKSILILERERLRGRDSRCDLDRLAQIAQRQGRFAESVGLQRQAVEATRYRIVEFLEQHPELNHVDPDEPWDRVVFLPKVERVLESEKPELNAFREVYYRLGRALRLNGQLVEAEHALAVAKKTPWVKAKFYRQNLDFYVDREWAFLYLAQDEPEAARGKAEFCLGEYVMSPAEEIELLDLVSQAKEALGDLDGAMEALEAAIEIVETRRANLVTDEFKQSYAAGYAELYRRAMELSLLRNADFGLRNGHGPEAIPMDLESRTTIHDPRPTSDASRFTPDASRAFQWAERIKGRAMLDAVNRYDKSMSWAIAHSDTEQMRAVRELSSKVVSVHDLREAEWWPADTALLEFAYGADSPQRARSERGGQGIRNAEFGMRNMEPHQQEARTPKPEADPADHESRTPNHDLRLTSDASRFTSPASRVYLWVVTKNGASFHRLTVTGRELDELSSSLTTALQRRDDTWVEPATQLYEHTIRPIADRLQGISQLVIVGDGKLRTVPFEVLVAKRDANANRAIPHKLLIEDYAIGYAPSATLLDVISKAGRPTVWKQSLWAFASTQFGRASAETSRNQEVEKSEWEGAARHESRITNYRDVLRSARSLSLNDLPYTRKEVDQIVRFFPQSKTKIWIDQPNMKHVLVAAGKKGDLRSVRFLHFATHAIVDESRPFLAGLVLSPPYPTGSPDHNSSTNSRARMDGQADRGLAKSMPVEQPASHRTLDSILKRDRFQWSRPELLTLHELAELDLRSELVVLSACQSIGRRSMEGDWINGLARAFLMAGSSGVLCTLWETGDLLSASVVPAIYDVMLSNESAPARINVPRALQRYKTSVLDSPRLGHPANWTPFIYHGRL